MRWAPQPPTADMPWWVWLFLPIWGPATVLVVSAIALLWCKRKAIGPTDNWRSWFAWYPVTVSPTWDSRQRVWLEWVERRSGHIMADAEHRLASAHAPSR